jgi:DNA-binding CsgD family transcriptional regulator
MLDIFPEPRRHASFDAAGAQWMAATLDEIDYGMVLLTDVDEAIHINHAARRELDERHPLQLVDRQLRARCPQDAGRFTDALRDAERGLRHLVSLGEGERRVSVAVVPLPAGGPDQRLTLVMLGKRRMCEELSIQGFARGHGLTPAETRVLAELCNGMRPGDIAQRQGVAISTVRTQISSIRMKTESESIRQLVRRVAVLPPLMSVLRGAAPAQELELMQA